MFVIPCKFNKKSAYIINLIKGIREFHKNEKIMVVDSCSEDKSYFKDIEEYDVIIEDICNRNWMVGAYWHGYFKYPNEEYYYFIHDSTKVKANMDYLKAKPLTILATFNRHSNSSFNAWNGRINTETKYKVTDNGYGVYGPMILCQNIVMTTLYNKGANVLLPCNKTETGFMEGAFGALLECDGYNLMECSLFGDILQQESPGGKSFPPPFNTSWQHPIEKFYASHTDEGRK